MPWGSDNNSSFLELVFGLMIGCFILGASIGLGRSISRGGGTFIGLIFVGSIFLTAFLADLNMFLGIGFLIVYTIAGLIAVGTTAD